jgi:hypothetical protein
LHELRGGSTIVFGRGGCSGRCAIGRGCCIFGKRGGFGERGGFGAGE